MTRAASLFLALLLSLLAGPAQASAPVPANPFGKWAAVVVAGDWRAHSGEPTEAFDNARRDVAATLVSLGFASRAIRQYSVRPQLYSAPRPGKTELNAIHAGLRDSVARGATGCLVYITSHGAPDGATLDENTLPPPLLAAMIDDACPDRPSIVVVSACYSGVFLPPLQRRDRMILTASRADRASFGCGEDDRYPYFDDCFLSSARTAPDFAALGRATQACVTAKERDTGAEPASEPQLWIGAALRPVLPLHAFRRAVSQPASVRSPPGRRGAVQR